MSLEGKTVIVTGAGGAIGSEIAKAFAGEESNIIVNYRRSKDSAEKVAEECNELGGKAIAFQCDISHNNQIKKMIAEAVKLFGHLDILINNATIGPQIPFLELTEEDFEGILSNNVGGYWYCSQYAARQMVEQKTPGWIVNISSISSRSVTASYVHYAAGKGAIEAMTRGMAVALAPYNINVNCVAPGVVLTPTVRNMFEDPVNADPVVERTPGHKITEIKDVIGAVVFLCREEAKMIRGQVIDIDGGYSIHGMEWNMSEEMKKFRSEVESKGYRKK